MFKERVESEFNLNSETELTEELKSLNEGKNLEMKSLYLKEICGLINMETTVN